MTPNPFYKQTYRTQLNTLAPFAPWRYKIKYLREPLKLMFRALDDIVLSSFI